MCAIVKRKREVKLDLENQRENMAIEAITRTETLVENKGIV